MYAFFNRFRAIFTYRPIVLMFNPTVMTSLTKFMKLVLVPKLRKSARKELDLSTLWQNDND